MPMKKFILLALPVILLSACSKYEDGPAISFRTKKDRVCNTWVVGSAYKNGVDNTSEFNGTFAGYLLDIRKDETYTLSYTPPGVGSVNEEGHWNWDNDKLKITLTDSDGSVTEYLILKLKEKEFWVQFLNDNEEWEVHLVPKQ